MSYQTYSACQNSVFLLTFRSFNNTINNNIVSEYLQMPEKLYIFHVFVIAVSCHISCLIVLDVAFMSKHIPYTWSLAFKSKQTYSKLNVNVFSDTTTVPDQLNHSTRVLAISPLKSDLEGIYCNLLNKVWTHSPQTGSLKLYPQTCQGSTERQWTTRKWIVWESWIFLINISYQWNFYFFVFRLIRFAPWYIIYSGI